MTHIDNAINMLPNVLEEHVAQRGGEYEGRPFTSATTTRPIPDSWKDLQIVSERSGNGDWNLPNITIQRRPLPTGG